MVLTHLQEFSLSDKDSFKLLRKNMALKSDRLFDQLINKHPLANEQIQDLFELAVYKRYTYAIEFFLKNGADPNRKNKHDNTPIQSYSLYSNNEIDIIKILLKYGANPQIENKHGWTAMKHALTYSRFEIVSLLEQHGAILKQKDLEQALLAAARSNNVQQMDQLLERGAQITASLYFFCCISNEPDGILYLLSKDHEFSLTNKPPFLQLAAGKGYFQIVNQFIKKGRIRTAPSVFTEILSLALFACIESGDGKMLKYLVEQGADINFMDEGDTPYEFAVKTGQHSMAKLCKKLGGKRYKQNKKVIYLY